MTSVKGSPQYKLKVVQYRPWRRYSAISAGAVLIGLGFASSYLLGRHIEAKNHSVTAATITRLSADLAESQARSEQLNQQLANLHTGAQVDKQATEEVRREMLELKEAMAQLEEQNNFYRSLMAPSGENNGMTFGSVEITDTDNPRQYRYKVVMQQLARDHELLKGSLEFTVVGNTAGIETRYRLSDLSTQYADDSIKLRYKYFQNIEGTLSLPENFDPERIELVAKTTGKNAKTIEKRFGWLVGES